MLLLACINFINLSTARSEKRAREVGVRKAIGSKRYQLITQFLSESFTIVVMAFLLSLLLLALSQNSFNLLADKKIELPFTNLIFWLSAMVFVLITAVDCRSLSCVLPVIISTGKSPERQCSRGSLVCNAKEDLSGRAVYGSGYFDHWYYHRGSAGSICTKQTRWL
ncbi:MAG: FtsX-like permease family protein [Bacteroidota bacterium]